MTFALTEEGLLELAAGVEDPGDLLEVEEEPGDDVESVDEAEREEEAPSAAKDRQMNEEGSGKTNEIDDKSMSKRSKRQFSRSHMHTYRYRLKSMLQVA